MNQALAGPRWTPTVVLKVGDRMEASIWVCACGRENSFSKECRARRWWNRWLHWPLCERVVLMVVELTGTADPHGVFHPSLRS